MRELLRKILDRFQTAAAFAVVVLLQERMTLSQYSPRNEWCGTISLPWNFAFPDSKYLRLFVAPILTVSIARDFRLGMNGSKYKSSIVVFKMARYVHI